MVEKNTADKNEQLKKEVAQRYLELQMFDKQIKTLQAQINALEAQNVESEAAAHAIDELSKMSPGRKIFSQVAPGIYADAELKGADDLLVMVGGSAAVKKSAVETKEMLLTQAKETRKLQQELSAQLEKLVLAARNIEQEIIRLARK